MNDLHHDNPQQSPTSDGADLQPQGSATSSQQRTDMRYGWLKLVIKPALFLAAGMLFIVGLGAAQKVGWISAGGAANGGSADGRETARYICPMM